MKTSNFLIFFGIFLMIIGLFGVIIVSTKFIIEGEKVDCYDKYGSKIIGVECVSDGNHISDEGIPFMIIALFLMIIGFFMITFGIAKLNVIEGVL